MDNKRQSNKTVDLEKEELKKRIDQLELLLKQQGLSSVSNDAEVEEVSLKPDDYIKVMSLVNYTLNLSTLGFGKGKIFKFSRFGEMKRILYSDLVDIMESQRKFMESGLFYILDKRVIRHHGLDDIYAKLLDKNKIEEILSGSMENAISLYESANSQQREIINDMFIAKIRDNETVDLNTIAAISRVGKVDLAAKAEEAKSFA